MNLKKRYEKSIESRSHLNRHESGITENTLSGLPTLIKDYIVKCGYIGTPRVINQEIVWENTFHRADKKNKFMELDYYQFISLDPFERYVYINAKIMEIEENCIDGVGAWNMLFLKIFNIINVRNTMEVNATALVTFLSEFSIAPLLFLTEGVAFGNVSSVSIEVSVSRNDMSVSGTFHFDNMGFIDRFETSDRYSSIDGKTYTKMDWIGRIENYIVIDGIRFPGRFTAAWNDKGDEFVYFHGDIKTIRTNV